MATGSRNTGGGTAVAPAAPGAAADRFPALIEGSRERIGAILPPGITPERFIKTALVAYSQNGDLKKCTPASILLSVMQAAELGLEIGKPLDLCHLVPFGQECTLVIDYKGWVRLAYNTGFFADIDAILVHERDQFEYYRDPLPRVRHVPHLGPDRGAITHAYAYTLSKDAAIGLEVMTIAEVEKVRAGSRSANSPAWRNHYGEMCRKVPLKRHLKRKPRSATLARAAEIDDAGHDLEIAVSTPRRALPGATRAEQMAAALDPPDEPAFAEGTAGRIGTEADDDRPADEFEDEPGSKG
jgi:recombination protein RecT